jgi:hypothetical protein
MLKGLKFDQMILLLAFLIALLFGLGGLFNWLPFTPTTVDLHIVSGIIMAIAILVLAISISRAGKPGAAALWIGFAAIFIGGLMGLFLHIGGNFLGIIHLTLMLIAMGLAEMGASVAKKSLQS